MEASIRSKMEPSFAKAMEGWLAPERKSMRQYELTYLISDVVPEVDLNKVTGKVGGYVQDLSGKLLKEDIWGRRKLAYPIKKMDFATYVTVNFDLPAEKAIEFERNIKLTGKIIRHLMTVKDHGAEALTLSKEEIAETEEIQEVTGGEKSFEAIEGETEESKNLMAKRVETEEEVAKKEQAPGLETTEVKEIKAEEKEEIKAIALEEKLEKAAAKTKEKPKKAEEQVYEKEEVLKPEKISAKKATVKKVKKEPDSEADRLSKLDEELDKFLGEDL